MNIRDKRYWSNIIFIILGKYPSRCIYFYTFCGWLGSCAVPPPVFDFFRNRCLNKYDRIHGMTVAKVSWIVLAPLCKVLCWQNTFSITSLFKRPGIMEALFFWNLYIHNSSIPKIQDINMSCLVWCEIRQTSFCFIFSSERMLFSHLIKKSITSWFSLSLSSLESVIPKILYQNTCIFQQFHSAI